MVDDIFILKIPFRLGTSLDRGIRSFIRSFIHFVNGLLVLFYKDRLSLLHPTLAALALETGIHKRARSHDIVLFTVLPYLT